MWLMSLFFDLFVQLVSDFRLQLWRLKWRRLKWHRDSPRCLVIFAYDNMMHCTFLLAWVVSWKQLQYPSLHQVCQTPLSGNMAHGSTKEEWGAKGTSGFSAFIKKIDYIWIWIQIWHDSDLGTLIVGVFFFGGIGRILMKSQAFLSPLVSILGTCCRCQTWSCGESLSIEIGNTLGLSPTH